MATEATAFASTMPSNDTSAWQTIPSYQADASGYQPRRIAISGIADDASLSPTHDNRACVPHQRCRSTATHRFVDSACRGRLRMTTIVLVLASLCWIGGNLYARPDGMESSSLYYPQWPGPLLMGKGKMFHRAVDDARVAKEFILNDPSDASDVEGRDRHNKRKDKHSGKERAQVLASPGCEGSVVIVRHCEKEQIREHCDYVGYERAVYLSTLFGDDDESRWPAPSYLFALNAGGRHNQRKRNYREIETVDPVSRKFNLTVNHSFTEHEGNKLAKHIFDLLKAGEMCGKVVLISWKHSHIPQLAHKLGCGPLEGCPMDYPSMSFDLVFQIKFRYMHLAHSERKSGKIDKHPKWRVYGSAQNEDFDPLQFSKQMKDYPAGGTDVGGRWMKMDKDSLGTFHGKR